MMEEQKYYRFVGIGRYLRFAKAKKFAMGKILNVGFSDGVSLSLFGDKDDIVGIDIDKNRLEIAKKFGKVIYAGAEDLPFENETFDSVVTLEVIEYVKKKEHALGEMSRVLKRGGTLIISFLIELFKGHP